MTLSPEDLAARVAANVITEVFKSVWRTLQGTEKWFANKQKEHDFLGLAARHYASKLEEQYGLIRILGMEKPISLRDIYVNVDVLEKITERQRVSIEALERFFDRDRRTFGFKRETILGSAAVDKLDKFIVLGKPGAGKTTFLKHIMFQSLDGRPECKRIPVFISLKDFSDSGKFILDYIVDEFDICGFPDARLFVLRVLTQGKCQLLFDGLDEVSKKQEDFVISELSNFSRKYSSNQFVISCRIAAYSYWFDTFTDVEIADFTDAQIKQFISNWFADESSTAERCWHQMSLDPPIKELATVPLLLTLLCLAFSETMEFPPNRADLYKEAIDALLKKWDSSRRIKRSQIYKHLSVKRKEFLFSRIAAETFDQGRYFIPQRTLEGYISDFIQHLPESSEAALETDSEAILKAIEAQHGILVQRARGIYSFSHLTFQEYFTAQYIVEHSDEGTLEKLVNQHLYDDRWREVFLLTAGMLQTADNFLQLIKSSIDEIVKKSGLDALFDRLAQLIKQEGTTPYSSVFGRSIAILNSLMLAKERGKYQRQFTGNETLDRELRLALGLLREIEYALPLAQERKQPISSKEHALIAELKRALKRAHGDPRKMYFGVQKDLNLETYELEPYMKAYLLLFECLRSESYVLRPVREQLVHGLYSLQ